MHDQFSLIYHIADEDKNDQRNRSQLKYKKSK